MLTSARDLSLTWRGDSILAVEYQNAKSATRTDQDLLAEGGIAVVLVQASRDSVNK